jgi:MFS family permease
MWAIGAGHGLSHSYAAALALLLPFIARDLNLTYSQIGFLLTIRQLMSTVVNLPAGVAVDAVGRRDLFMTVALLGVAGPFLVLSVAHSMWTLAVCVGLMGFSSFLWHPAAITSISELYPTHRGYGLAIHELGANLGETLVPLFTGALLGVLAWRQVIPVTVAIGVLLTIVVLRVVFRQRRRLDSVAHMSSGTDYLAGLRVLIRNGNLLILAVVSGIRLFAQQGLHNFLPLYLVNDLRIPAVLVGVYIAVVQVSGMVATPISGTLSDRIGPKRVATAGMLATSLVVVAFAVIDLGSAFVAALALVGFFTYSMRPAIFRWAIGLAPREYEGTAVGGLFTTQALFSTAMPLVGGVIADRLGLIVVFYVIAVALVVANLTVLFVPDLRR